MRKSENKTNSKKWSKIHGREQRLHWVKAGSWVYSQHCSFANTFNNVNSHCALCAVQFMAENTHFSSKHFIYSHGGQLSWRTQSNCKWQTKKLKIKLERGVERACVGWRRTRWAPLRVCLSEWEEGPDGMFNDFGAELHSALHLWLDPEGWGSGTNG